MGTRMSPAPRPPIASRPRPNNLTRGPSVGFPTKVCLSPNENPARIPIGAGSREPSHLLGGRRARAPLRQLIRRARGSSRCLRSFTSQTPAFTLATSSMLQSPAIKGYPPSPRTPGPSRRTNQRNRRQNRQRTKRDPNGSTATIKPTPQQFLLSPPKPNY